ncbi:gamma carbonic anhydrase family protein [Planococcus sp. N028]|uniref:Gamma carbonic anhydrase family protein n=1 Tax=Planococcus shixiaomingii TaxID=3058393 RepID=A0ABT8MX03_9BACL|nr:MULTISPECIES: gamma carbonic anhydrase family protein [unclassified Planococcus (in: firmicutes)]MDN7240176.1 gamma carbonic anhydrase family protein [Planococcus sp. N028]WKA56080.1 gamma carbonic anhydrase family protein [Planococcus sp. N022]
MIYPFKDKHPAIDPSVFVADFATITGDVTIGAKSSVWFNTVIRGDVAPTVIGKKVNIQDLCMLHQSPGKTLLLEDNVTIGHQVTLHSCIIRKGALIGMGSIILDGAEVGEGAFIGAGSLVPPGKKIPPGMLALGRPAKVVRELREDDKIDMERIVREYAEKAAYYKSLQQPSKTDVPENVNPS